MAIEKKDVIRIKKVKQYITSPLSFLILIQY